MGRSNWFIRLLRVRTDIVHDGICICADNGDGRMMKLTELSPTHLKAYRHWCLRSNGKANREWSRVVRKVARGNAK